MAGRLSNKIALVTGGTRGIGKAIATRYASEGASVIAVGRKESVAPLSAGVAFFRADVSSAQDVAALFSYVLKKYGRIDILVNNAGIELEKTIEETTEEEWDTLIDINLKGPFLCCREAIKPMRAAGGGSIVNIGSVEGFAADPHLGAYCASKGGIHAMTRSIAVDFGRDRIRCNAICPGWIKTEMTEGYFQRLPDPQSAERTIVAMHPAGRMGNPEDIASLAVWLGSDEASFATGQLYTLDGGLTAQIPFPTKT